MHKKFRPFLFLLCGLLLLVPLVAGPKSEDSPEGPTGDFVYSVKISGAITPSTMDQLNSAIEKAEDDGARALIVILNTPGGLMHSMDEMCRNILNSGVPVFTFVWPPGAYAGSAGVYIMYSSHLSAMAPATNIGSATPVSMGGEEKKDAPQSDRIPDSAGTDDTKNMKRKLMNHAKAQIRGFAEYHGRNAKFAELTITHAENITSAEAASIHAIDLVATSPADLLKKADGRTVRMVDGKKKLELKNAKIITIEGDFRNRFLSFLTNPAIVNLLMMIGVLGILAEIQYPGSVFPGVIGAICLVLGLYAMQSLPVNYAGVGLIILGVIFFILEIKVVSYGMLSVAGAVSLIIGSIMLAKSGDQLMWDTLAIMLATSAIFIGIMVFLVYKAAEVMRLEPVSGVEGLLSEHGRVMQEVSGSSGSVFIHSEIWAARSATAGRVIPLDASVRVKKVEGLVLYVEPDDSV